MDEQQKHQIDKLIHLLTSHISSQTQKDRGECLDEYWRLLERQREQQDYPYQTKTPYVQIKSLARESSAREIFDEKLTSAKEHLLELEKEEERLTRIALDLPDKDIWIAEVFLERNKEEIKRAYREKHKWRRFTLVNNGIETNELRIEEARDVPIEDLYDFEQITSTQYRMKALCPLHKEKTPSFTIYLSNNSYFCFGCASGGNAITFIKKLYSITTREAVELILK